MFKDIFTTAGTAQLNLDSNIRNLFNLKIEKDKSDNDARNNMITQYN